MLRRNRGRRNPPPSQNRPDSSRLAPEVIANPVNQAAHWSQDVYSLQALMDKFPLPQIVRCSDRLLSGEERGLPVNVYVPLLLFSSRAARKLLAKHVAPDTRGQDQPRLTETDESIVIPGDYDGHFLRLQARTTNDISMVRSLKFIVKNPVPAFVNFTPVVSFMSDQSQYSIRTDSSYPNNSNNINHSHMNGDSYSHTGSGASKGSKGSSKKSGPQAYMVHQQKVLYPPGSVFMVRGTIKGLASHKKRSREVTLLKCTDASGKEIHIPSDQPGEFIEVEIPTNGSNKLSMLPRDLIAANRYPGLVRFVYGDHAPRLTPCSLMFNLVDTFEEESVIGCLLYPKHAMMIEVPFMSSLSFQVALNRDALMTLPLPRHAVGVVRARQETFVRDLKLKVKFLHRVNAATHESEIGEEEDMPSATMRARLFINEAFFYL
ncbi:hypothetical protein PoB_003725200 [Plakobranchus ocellatus]|uniref:CABIT domain-containing protein n=1 Tax=Plakobranchus ocellatus TaxID=259542 RepID=A0AAV4ATV5_9GAST|nr:hypothetical protein PoB_003725200 [Plakobranchus ocellatus]